ncbi:Shikimate kinase/Threonine synthase-like 1 [Macleaya cordata]|uniref:Shikimate kinase/Threonine synthase-like 1 n=1 Tax=Macleaya cordata TaxID=56857 RepID=A0A200PXC5_MACCD|nr:Shikimate kinase/Threonine synthase-like 1 [Macleaya cordata]
MATARLLSTTLCFNSQNPLKTLEFSPRPKTLLCINLSPNFPLKRKAFTSPKSHFLYNKFGLLNRLRCISCKSLSTISINPKTYEFSDGVAEVELRLQLGGKDVQNSRDIFVDANESSLTIRVKSSGSLMTLIETTDLYGKIKPAETIWYIDEDQLVVSLKKHDPDLKWPDFVESWESLTAGIVPILKGTSIYIVGDSAEINQKVAKELGAGIGYTPLNTRDLLEAFAKQPIDSWVMTEGMDSVAEAESAVLESLSSHVRAVVATLGGPYGAAQRTDKWRHLYSGFTIWLSQSEATDEDSAKEEVQRDIQDGSKAYSNAEVVVKIGEWDPTLAQPVAQACLSALKRLILADKKLPGKKNLYIRLGCRGDWPNIKPPGWDPSAESNIPAGV